MQIFFIFTVVASKIVVSVFGEAGVEPLLAAASAFSYYLLHTMYFFFQYVCTLYTYIMDKFSSAPATQLTPAANAPAASLANPQASPKVPKTPRRHEITRDQRRQVQTWAGVGLKYAEIAEELGSTIRQVQYANTHRLTPQRRKRGRHGKLRQEQIDHLVEWLCSSKENRRTAYRKIRVILYWDVSENALCYALKNPGFHRYIHSSS